MELEKVINKYSKIYRTALETNVFSDVDIRVESYKQRLKTMYESDVFAVHNVYPTMDVYKVYAVIAMCLELKKEDLSDKEIIDIVNSGFAKLRKMFELLEKVIDALPNAYQIAKKWNISDHDNRVKDGSITYDHFNVSEGKIEYCISKCMYIEMFEYYGIRSLCKIFCITDETAYSNLTRHVKFIRHSDLSDGECCHDEVVDRKYLKKHILISKEMENVIKKHLAEKFSKNDVELYWKKLLQQYAVFLKDLPDVGGKKSRHNGTGGTYDCISLFAYYEVLNHEPSLDELYQMNCEVFLPEFKKMASIVNANKSFYRRLLHLAFVMTAKTDEGRDGGYIMKVEPYNKEEGVRYRFERCPIAEFAKSHGYLNIMPAFCNSDYPAMEYINAALIRKHTCANSDVCDYWIVGDESREANEHPRKTDSDGYWHND